MTLIWYINFLIIYIFVCNIIRKVIEKALVTQYSGILESGWPLTGDDIFRDVHTLLGGSYEEYMSK